MVKERTRCLMVKLEEGSGNKLFTMCLSVATGYRYICFWLGS